MSAVDSATLQRLVHPDTLTYERGLQDLHAWRTEVSSDEVGAAVIGVLAAVEGADPLGESERSRRTQAALGILAPPPAALPDIASAAREWSADVKLAVAAFLPSNMRRLVYGKPQVPGLPSAEDRDLEARPPSAAESAGEIRESERPRYRTVLLFGASHDHEANLTRLKQAGFDPLRVDRPEQLEGLLNEAVCGIVVGESWWPQLPPETHEAFLNRVFSHSTFTWVKIDESGYQATSGQPIQDLHRAVRFTDALQLNVGDSCRVSDYDIENFRRSSEELSASLRAQLEPGEINAGEAPLLLAAISRCVHARHFTRPVRLARVAVALVSGGRSAARLYRVEPDDGGAPVIAKLDDIPRLQDEMARFRRFIHRWDDRLSPCLHFHGKTGAIVFTLVDEPENPGALAPTLEVRLHAAMYAELSATPPAAPREADLQVTVERAVAKLSNLNRCTPADLSLPSRQWLSLEGLEAMLARGVKWRLPIDSGRTRDALAIGQAALAVTGRFAEKAVVHGDVHLGNLLVRDDREPYFIDYALSGPGHPCFDLVRFESALAFRCMRMTSDEARIAEMTETVAKEDVGADAIFHVFPDLASSAVNRLAIRASVLCRDACMAIMRPFGGTLLDYLAVRYVVACQSLTLPECQTGIVRGTLIGLARLLDRKLG